MSNGNTKPKAQALPPVQRTWIEAVSSQAALAAKQRDKADQQEKALAELDKDLDGMRESIQSGQSYSVTKVPNTVWEKVKGGFGKIEKLSALDPGSDPMEEIDTWHDLPGTEALPPDQVRAVMESMKKVVDLSRKMESKQDAQGNALFSPDEIAQGLWQSLVREGVLPENAVPDRYSEVKKTFDAAVTLYEERLQEHSRGLDDKSKLLDVLGKGKFFIEKAGTIASSVAGAHAGVVAAKEGVQKVKESAQAKEVLEVKKTIDLVNVCLSSTGTIAESVIKRDEAESAADAFGKALTGIVTASAGKEVGKIVGAAYTSAVKASKFGYKMAEGSYDDAALALADTVSNYMKLLDEPPSKTCTSIGGYIAVGIRGVVASGRFVKAVREHDSEAMVSALTDGLKLAADQVGNKILSDQAAEAKKKIDADDSLSDKEQKAQKAAIDKSLKGKKGGLDSGTGSLKEAADMLPKIAFSPEALKKLAAKEAEIAKTSEEDEKKSTEQMYLEMLDQPDHAFENLMSHGFALATDEDEQRVQDEERQLQSIEMMVVQLKKDQMVFELAEKVSTGGPKVVQQFFPPAQIVGATAEFVIACIKAVQHTRELLAWMDNVRDARAAVTVQADAMLNRLGLEQRQTLEAGIKAALKAVEVVGAVGTSTVLFAPAGQAISGSAQAAQATMDIISKVVTEKQMHDAWNVYKKALDTPQDRKLARNSLRQNPTLAKYAIAYGAVTERNAVALKAMDQCGLSDKVLTNPSTSVNKVVQYMETMYREDPVLLKAVPEKKKWHPGPVELTLESWAKFVLKAQREAKPQLALQDVSRINAAMSLYAGKHKEFQDADAEHKAEIAAGAREVGQELQLSITKYRPLDANGTRHQEMEDYMESLIANLDIRMRGYAEEIRQAGIASGGGD